MKVIWSHIITACVTLVFGCYLSTVVSETTQTTIQNISSMSSSQGMASILTIVPFGFRLVLFFASGAMFYAGLKPWIEEKNLWNKLKYKKEELGMTPQEIFAHRLQPVEPSEFDKKMAKQVVLPK